MAAPAFEPLQLAPRSRRVLVVLVGPVLWLIGIVVVGLVVQRRGSVQFGLEVTVIAFLVSLPICWLARLRRLREERRNRG
jgi:low temperature requirement protein LtrA